MTKAFLIEDSPTIHPTLQIVVIPQVRMITPLVPRKVLLLTAMPCA